MPWWVDAAAVVIGMLGAMALGIPVAFAFAIAGIIGLLITEGPHSLNVIPQMVHDTGSDFVLVTVPLFIFMAEVLAAGGFTTRLFKAFDTVFGRIPGSSALATLCSCGAFASVCGSSYVTVATIGRMALPELLARNYTKKLSAGIVAAGGTLGILIPPSLTFIMFGMLTDISIGQLFFAGVIPGLLLLLFFCIAVFLKMWLSDDKPESPGNFSLHDKVRALIDVLPIFAVAIIVLSSIYFGFATPTESAAVGCTIAILAGLIYRTLSFSNFVISLRATTYVTGFIFLLLYAAKILAYLYAMIGVSDELGKLAMSVGQPYLVLLAAFIILGIMGMLMDGMAMLVLAVPVFTPILTSLGFSPIWFGVIFVVFTELGLITPPVGVNCYMVASFGKEYGLTMQDTFGGVLPFCFCMLLVVVMLVLFPQLALWLPSTMIR